MCSARFGLPLFLLLLVAPVWGQTQTPANSSPSDPSQQTTTPPPGTKDPQAVNIANQALNVAGGASAIAAITDYTATGNITYHMAQDVQGTVTVKGRGLGQFRMDSNVPAGLVSQAISGHVSVKGSDGIVKPLRTQAPMEPGRVVLPYLLLRPALATSGYSISYKGMVQLDGNSVHDIQVQRNLRGSPSLNVLYRDYLTVDFFIDPSTFQVVAMQDFTSQHVLRQIRYSNFKLVNGVLVPFLLAEQVLGRTTWQIQLDQINFNADLQDSDFQL